MNISIPFIYYILRGIRYFIIYKWNEYLEMNFYLTFKSYTHVSPFHFFTEICNLYHYDFETVEQENEEN